MNSENRTEQTNTRWKLFEITALKNRANKEGMTVSQLIRKWVLEKLFKK